MLFYERCREEEISIDGHWFGIVHDYEWKIDTRVSGINIYNNPEQLGDFIVLGQKKKRLVGLTEGEICFIKLHIFTVSERAVLYGID